MERKSILIEDEEIVMKEIKAKTEIKDDSLEVIPHGYVKIELDSLGKLTAPKVLHFRNYSMAEAIELSSASEDKNIDVLISCLNKMVYEKFDCADLHDKELEEVMVQIYMNFWGKNLEGYRYYVDNTLTGDALYSEENIEVATLEISKLNTIPLDEKFKEPLKVELDGVAVKFRLARIKDIIVSRNYIEKKYYNEERKLSDLLTKYLKDNESVTYEEKEQIEVFQKEKNIELVKVIQANLILEIDGKGYNTLEEKLEAYNLVSIKHWQKLNNYIENDLKFGINPQVTFFCMKNKKKITRGFRFQSLDFLPPVGIYTDSGATLSFGD